MVDAQPCSRLDSEALNRPMETALQNNDKCALNCKYIDRCGVPTSARNKTQLFPICNLAFFGTDLEGLQFYPSRQTWGCPFHGCFAMWLEWLMSGGFMLRYNFPLLCSRLSSPMSYNVFRDSSDKTRFQPLSVTILIPSTPMYRQQIRILNCLQLQSALIMTGKWNSA